MKTSIIVTLLLIYNCTGFSQEPTIEFLKDGYRAVIVATDSGRVLMMLRGDQSIHQVHFPDGYIDTLEFVEINNDGIPDIIYEERFCDGREVYLSYSQGANQLIQEHILSIMAGAECELPYKSDGDQIEFTNIRRCQR